LKDLGHLIIFNLGDFRLDVTFLLFTHLFWSSRYEKVTTV